jgi:hypothetical protein
MSTIQAFFSLAFIFFYFKSNNNCRLLTINIVSFIFFYYRESKPPFCLHYEKSSPLNIVYRKINWQNPASISAYTQSENRISNYVIHIRIIPQYVDCAMALKFMSINRSIIIYNIELFKSKLCKHVYFYSVLKVIARSCYSNIIPLMFG